MEFSDLLNLYGVSDFRCETISDLGWLYYYVPDKLLVGYVIHFNLTCDIMVLFIGVNK